MFGYTWDNSQRYYNHATHRTSNPIARSGHPATLRKEVAARGVPTMDLATGRSADWLDEVEAEALRRLRPAQLELL